ncbi:MAG: hypothetical protein JOZ80_18910 [Acidobacteriaceae bacterium]|nr:hypothetical protein [Acidobacteriaceae bacterium]
MQTKHGQLSQTVDYQPRHNSVVDPESLVRYLQDFLASARDAVIIEDGASIFDLTQSRYSISGEYNKCLLHIWSAERNIVRRVLEAEIKNEALRLSVQRLGQSKPTKLEICRERDRRTPNAKRAARLAYQRMLQRVLARKFPACKAAPLSSTMDLERSLGPVYARGLLRQGQSGFAVLGVNAEETQASVDAALTFGILWLDICRQRHAGSLVIEGLKLFLPSRRSSLTRERMAHLNADAAKWQLFEIEERSADIRDVDLSDRGNIETRLAHPSDESAVRERFAEPIAQIRQLMSETDIAILSSAEIAFRCYGLEFARARIACDAASLQSTIEIIFGLGSEEVVLSEANGTRFTDLVRSIGEVRHAQGPHDHPLFRLHPERWLESLVVKNVSCLDERLDATRVYSQVPAFSASDRAMIDVLCGTRDGRLAVLEPKADEDIHLPLQGVDYWSRVVWHHARGEFARFGYFPERELSPQQPLLFLVAPALHIHPATDTLLRYISPQITWELLAVDEHWREAIRVVFRKHNLPRTIYDSPHQREAVAARTA